MLGYGEAANRLARDFSQAGFKDIVAYSRSGAKAQPGDPLHQRAQAAGDPDTGETYYRHWLATLEHLVAAKGVATSETLHRYRDAWDHAADRTPHGMPIELTPADFR